MTRTKKCMPECKFQIGSRFPTDVEIQARRFVSIEGLCMRVHRSLFLNCRHNNLTIIFDLVWYCLGLWGICQDIPRWTQRPSKWKRCCLQKVWSKLNLHNRLPGESIISFPNPPSCPDKAMVKYKCNILIYWRQINSGRKYKEGLANDNNN